MEGKTMPRSNPEVELPVKPALFHILLALSKDKRHGLVIADEAVLRGALHESLALHR